ncbi:hypothetical protein K488DRAFT_86578 [Vararia minispora EC-137]|uniref:Uncharacterized protein n=1 Tax=Vararia minispora EC-137 TaxID=1314806 RepID=A0ACB8QIM0_9AGAM|nr:hypothetical protein K488DRAFT_86578 [Vararia minispora EC-137]
MRLSGRIPTILSLSLLASLPFVNAQPSPHHGSRNAIARHAHLVLRQGSNGNGSVNSGSSSGSGPGPTSSTPTASSTPVPHSSSSSSPSSSASSTRQSTSSKASAPPSSSSAQPSSSSAAPSSTTTTSSSARASTTSSSISSSSSSSSVSSSAISSSLSSSSSVLRSSTSSSAASTVSLANLATNLGTLATPTDSSNVADSTSLSGPSASIASAKGATSFFSNTGAVAGTFTAVGIVTLVAAFFLFRFMRRRRQYDDGDFYFEEKQPAAGYGSTNDIAGTSRGYDAGPDTNGPHVDDHYPDPDAGQTMMEHAPTNAYPDRSIHYGADTYGNTNTPHDQAIDYADFGLDLPPQAAFAQGSSDSRPSTQYAGVGAGFAPSHLPAEYQTASDPYYQEATHQAVQQQDHPFSDPAMRYGNAYEHDSFYGGASAK